MSDSLVGGVFELGRLVTQGFVACASRCPSLVCPSFPTVPRLSGGAAEPGRLGLWCIGHNLRRRRLGDRARLPVGLQPPLARRTGRTCVLYGESEAPLWHQRRILGRLALLACDVVSLTPDGDIYSESYGDDNGDVQAVRYAVFGEAPLGVSRSAVYRFRHEPSTAEIEGAMVQARLIAGQE